jgi:hypothetical protein
MPALTDSGRSGQASSSGQSLTTSARQGTQILHPEVVKLLEEWLATKPDLAPNTLLFPVSGPIPGGKERKTHKMMKRDLEGARKTWIEEVKAIEEQARRKATDFLKYCNADGLFADFHSNRHLFITSLERAGLSPKMAQSLARHSDIRLTLDVYTHVELHDQTAAINSLPAPPGNDVGQPNEAAALAATGTDGPDVPASTCDKAARMVPTMVPRGAEMGAERLASDTIRIAPNCTEDRPEGEESEGREIAATSDEIRRIDTSSHQSASICTDQTVTRKEVSPRGFEPLTFGFGGHAGIHTTMRVSSLQTKVWHVLTPIKRTTSGSPHFPYFTRITTEYHPFSDTSRTVHRASANRQRTQPR